MRVIIRLTASVKLLIGFWGRPLFPRIRAGEDRAIIGAVQLGPVAAFGFKIVQIFQEQQSRGLFHIVEFVCHALFVA